MHNYKLRDRFKENLNTAKTIANLGLAISSLKSGNDLLKKTNEKLRRENSCLKIPYDKISKIPLSKELSKINKKLLIKNIGHGVVIYSNDENLQNYLDLCRYDENCKLHKRWQEEPIEYWFEFAENTMSDYDENCKYSKVEKRKDAFYKN
jgi:hypothetical protein